MTDRYAVFGNPIAQSKSPQLHRAFAQQTEQDMTYSKQEIPLDHFEQSVRAFQKQGGKGLNVTVPFKLEAYALADQLSERARLANAVNTLIFKDNGEIYGDNTDGAGLVSDLLQTHRWPITDRRLLILGAGGAVRGVLGPLLSEKPKAIYLMNRTFSKAETLADLFPAGKLQAVRECPEVAIDLIINGSSAGLHGQPFSLSGVRLSDNCQCYDMIYGNEPTPFLRWASEQGVKQVSDGIGMLVHQGAESFRLWRGVKPDALQVIDELLKQR